MALAEQSILDSVKLLNNIAVEDDSFDEVIVTHINTVFSVMYEIGACPAEGFYIEDNTTKWEEYIEGRPQLILVKSYMGLKVRSYFDPPVTSFALESLKAQIAELEWRLSTMEITFNPNVYDFVKETKPVIPPELEPII